jgi:hypothetical protein
MTLKCFFLTTVIVIAMILAWESKYSNKYHLSENLLGIQVMFFKVAKLWDTIKQSKIYLYYNLYTTSEKAKAFRFLEVVKF